MVKAGIIVNFFAITALKDISTLCQQGFPGGVAGRESTGKYRRYKRCIFDPWVGKISRRKWQPTPAFLPRNGQRSLAGCSHKESDMTEHKHKHEPSVSIIT